MKQTVRLLNLRIRKPARLTLQTTKKVALGKGNSIKLEQNTQNGPFAGMNQTKANIRARTEWKTKRLEIRRTNEDPRNKRRSNRRNLQREREFKALKMQSPLATVSYTKRSSTKKELEKSNSFEDFGLQEVICKSIYTQALKGLINVKPTPVQKIAIPALLSQNMKRQRSINSDRETFLIAAETGSGKTLAYILPALNAMKLAENNDNEIQEFEEKLKEERFQQSNANSFSPPLKKRPHPTTGRPKVIILVPTQELVAQIGAVVKLFGHTVKFRSAMISSAFTATVIRNRLFSTQGIDVVISTPHLISSIADGHPNILSRVTHLIIDEADSLFDKSFADITSSVIDRATPSLKQLVMCSATIPLALDSYLRSRFPETKRLVTPNLHAIPRRVQLEVINVEGVPFHGKKNLACADTIWSIGKSASDLNDTMNSTDVKNILIFVNEREKTSVLRDYLISKGIYTIALNRDTPMERKSEVLSSFTKSGLASLPKEDQSRDKIDKRSEYTTQSNKVESPKKVLPNVKAVVTTDLNSRGIDTVAVKNVILYDVPHSTIDFIHRLGRLGRMGRRGRGYVLVGKDDRKDVVAEVRAGMFRGISLI
ncbi:ATP-dependent RNA helicase mrh4, mitochondrial [Erysiphe necator]|nr:ATP-dependent RNA helicase mrh4, mitochondrial [Erysiphe necator]